VQNIHERGGKRPYGAFFPEGMMRMNKYLGVYLAARTLSASSLPLRATEAGPWKVQKLVMKERGAGCFDEVPIATRRPPATSRVTGAARSCGGPPLLSIAYQRMPHGRREEVSSRSSGQNNLLCPPEKRTSTTIYPSPP
jgi:hypothetical protein